MPIAAEVDRWPASHRQSGDAIDLLAVTDAALVLTPGRLLGVAEEIGPGDVVVMPKFTATQTGRPPRTGEVGFRTIRAGAVDAHMGISVSRGAWLIMPSVQTPVTASDPRSEPVT